MKDETTRGSAILSALSITLALFTIALAGEVQGEPMAESANLQWECAQSTPTYGIAELSSIGEQKYTAIRPNSADRPPIQRMSFVLRLPANPNDRDPIESPCARGVMPWPNKFMWGTSCWGTIHSDPTNEHTVPLYMGRIALLRNCGLTDQYGSSTALPFFYSANNASSPWFGHRDIIRDILEDARDSGVYSVHQLTPPPVPEYSDPVPDDAIWKFGEGDDQSPVYGNYNDKPLYCPFSEVGRDAYIAECITIYDALKEEEYDVDSDEQLERDVHKYWKVDGLVPGIMFYRDETSEDPYDFSPCSNQSHDHDTDDPRVAMAKLWIKIKEIAWSHDHVLFVNNYDQNLLEDWNTHWGILTFDNDLHDGFDLPLIPDGFQVESGIDGSSEPWPTGGTGCPMTGQPKGAAYHTKEILTSPSGTCWSNTEAERRMTYACWGDGGGIDTGDPTNGFDECWNDEAMKIIVGRGLDIGLAYGNHYNSESADPVDGYRPATEDYPQDVQPPWWEDETKRALYALINMMGAMEAASEIPLGEREYNESALTYQSEKDGIGWSCFNDHIAYATFPNEKKTLVVPLNNQGNFAMVPERAVENTPLGIKTRVFKCDVEGEEHIFTPGTLLLPRKRHWVWKWGEDSDVPPELYAERWYLNYTGPDLGAGYVIEWGIPQHSHTG